MNKENKKLQSILNHISSVNADNMWVRLMDDIEDAKVNHVYFFKSSIVKILNIEEQNLCFVIGMNIPKVRLSKDIKSELKQAFINKEKDIFKQTVTTIDDKMNVKNIPIDKNLLLSCGKGRNLYVRRISLSELLFENVDCNFGYQYFENEKNCYKYVMNELNDLILNKKNKIRDFINKINETEDSLLKISVNKDIGASQIAIEGFLRNDIREFETKTVSLIDEISDLENKIKLLEANYNEPLNTNK